jgi:hypothetical protein
MKKQEKIGYSAIKLYTRVYKVIGWAEKTRCTRTQKMVKNILVKSPSGDVFPMNYPIKLHHMECVIKCVE